VAAVTRGLLGCVTPIYRLGVWYRNRRFDAAKKQTGVAEGSLIKRASVPVISIGNITTGGTGKTPLVVAVAKHLRQQKIRVALVSRGYGSDPEQPGRNDEAMELEHRLPDVPHLQDPDRHRMAEIAVEELDSEVIVLDDGFQHRQLYRDLDIVTIDATVPFGYGRLLPRGLLREPIDNVCRADLVVITRVDLVSQQQTDQILNRLSKWISADQIVLTRMNTVHAINASGAVCAVAELKQQPTFVFCGIGNPDGFGATIEQIGIEITGKSVFPDHHRYDRSDIEAIGRAAVESGAKQIVCTHKDLVKVGIDRLNGLPLYAIQIDVEFISGWESMAQRIDQCLQKKPALESTG
ncbi:UNVERIFIED_CONTAM: hypothetical protein GTU68_016765, partial [Idotea baltica]|nr:hypothetical protein [Idotea baltica]